MTTTPALDGSDLERDPASSISGAGLGYESGAVLDEDLSRLETTLTGIVKAMHGPGSRLNHRVDRSGYFALGRLETCGQTRMSDLAGLLGLDPSTVSRMVRTLEELGLVARKPDPDDGRAALLVLTASGRAELATARAERQQLLKQALTGWNERDRARLLGLVDRLNTSIRDLHTSTAIREVRLS